MPTPPELVVTRHAELPDYAAAVRARARELGLTLHVLDPLPGERMPDLYAAADACVSIPASDGLPQTLLEALACLRPTVALDLDAYRELPFAADACLKVPHRGGRPALDALAAGLARALEQEPRPGLEVAERWVRAEASLEASLERVDALYRELATL